jgi:hypothetical protein
MALNDPEHITFMKGLGGKETASRRRLLTDMFLSSCGEDIDFEDSYNCYMQDEELATMLCDRVKKPKFEFADMKTLFVSDENKQNDEINTKIIEASKDIPTEQMEWFCELVFAGYLIYKDIDVAITEAKNIVLGGVKFDDDDDRMQKEEPIPITETQEIQVQEKPEVLDYQPSNIEEQKQKKSIGEKIVEAPSNIAKGVAESVRKTGKFLKNPVKTSHEMIEKSYFDRLKESEESGDTSESQKLLEKLSSLQEPEEMSTGEKVKTVVSGVAKGLWKTASKAKYLSPSTMLQDQLMKKLGFDEKKTNTLSTFTSLINLATPVIPLGNIAVSPIIAYMGLERAYNALMKHKNKQFADTDETQELVPVSKLKTEANLPTTKTQANLPTATVKTPKEEVGGQNIKTQKLIPAPIEKAEPIKEFIEPEKTEPISEKEKEEDIKRPEVNISNLRPETQKQVLTSPAIKSKITNFDVADKIASQSKNLISGLTKGDKTKEPVAKKHIDAMINTFKKSKSSREALGNIPFYFLFPLLSSMQQKEEPTETEEKTEEKPVEEPKESSMDKARREAKEKKKLHSEMMKQAEQAKQMSPSSIPFPRPEYPNVEGKIKHEGYTVKHILPERQAYLDKAQKKQEEGKKPEMPKLTKQLQDKVEQLKKQGDIGGTTAMNIERQEPDVQKKALEGIEKLKRQKNFSFSDDSFVHKIFPKLKSIMQFRDDSRDYLDKPRNEKEEQEELLSEQSQNYARERENERLEKIKKWRQQELQEVSKDFKKSRKGDIQMGEEEKKKSDFEKGAENIAKQGTEGLSEAQKAHEQAKKVNVEKPVVSESTSKQYTREGRKAQGGETVKGLANILKMRKAQKPQKPPTQMADDDVIKKSVTATKPPPVIATEPPPVTATKPPPVTATEPPQNDVDEMEIVEFEKMDEMEGRIGELEQVIAAQNDAITTIIDAIGNPPNTNEYQRTIQAKDETGSKIPKPTFAQFMSEIDLQNQPRNENGVLVQSNICKKDAEQVFFNSNILTIEQMQKLATSVVNISQKQAISNDQMIMFSDEVFQTNDVKFNEICKEYKNTNLEQKARRQFKMYFTDEAEVFKSSMKSKYPTLTDKEIAKQWVDLTIQERKDK